MSTDHSSDVPEGIAITTFQTENNRFPWMYNLGGQSVDISAAIKATRGASSIEELEEHQNDYSKGSAEYRIRDILLSGLRVDALKAMGGQQRLLKFIAALDPDKRSYPSDRETGEYIEATNTGTLRRERLGFTTEEQNDIIFDFSTV